MTLGDAKVGSTVVVTKIEGDSAYKRRIMDMGITKGSELFICLLYTSVVGSSLYFHAQQYFTSGESKDSNASDVTTPIPNLTESNMESLLF